MNDFEQYLLVSAVEIKKEIKNILSVWNSAVKSQTPSLINLNELLNERFSGGKYIRGTLVKLGSAITGAKENKEIIKIAAAFEILHTALLIHDDIIDKSTIRRGKKTIHSTFRDTHYGTSLAICLGDICFFLATKLIADSDFKPTKKNKITSEFSKIAMDTMLGEMLDVKTSFEKSKKEKDVITIQKLKTAYYTIVGPLSIGAMLGNIDEKQKKAIVIFGEYIGMAYQIQDDILGVFGDEKKIGKSTLSDIAENKNTLLITHALKKATLKQQRLLKTFYGKKDINKKQLNIIKNIFAETGSLAYSQKMAHFYSNKGIEQIPNITKNKKFQAILVAFASFITTRQK